MPVLTCGGMRFQHRWEEEPPQPIPLDNQANLEQIVARALELGIRHFETARGYGTSEAQLGPILQKIHRDNFILQTKVAPVADPEEFERAFCISLSKLGLPWVDLLSLHGVNDRETADWSLRPGGCLERPGAGKRRVFAAMLVFRPTGRPTWWKISYPETVSIM